MSALFECQDCDYRTLSVRSAEHHENTTPHEVFETLYRPRVSFTDGSIAKVVTARRRYICGNHLIEDDRHYIEPGQRYVRNSLPPHNREIGNENWWFLRVCLDCCPEKHDERRQEAPDGRA